MIVIIMDIVLMEHADANQDTVVLIVLQDLVQMIAQVVEVAINLFVSAMKVTWDSIAHLEHAQMSVPEMVIVTMEHATVIQVGTELVVPLDHVPMIVLISDIVTTEHAIVMLVMLVLIALFEHAQESVQTMENVLISHAHVTLVSQDMIVQFVLAPTTVLQMDIVTMPLVFASQDLLVKIVR